MPRVKMNPNGTLVPKGRYEHRLGFVRMWHKYKRGAIVDMPDDIVRAYPDCFVLVDEQSKVKTRAKVKPDSPAVATFAAPVTDPPGGEG